MRTTSHLSPPREDDRLCDRTAAVLCVYPREGSGLTHEAVTALLGVRPTRAGNAGDDVPTRRGSRRVTVTNWQLSSEPHVASKDLRNHLDWLLDRVGPAAAALRALQDGRAVMTVRCPWWAAADGTDGPVLWPEQMRRLADLNLELAFDFKDYSEDPGETPAGDS